tara:strand:- start:454 stop:681 length:228 start_codon:yes stop_codon:yes gene_type:complete
MRNIFIQYAWILGLGAAIMLVAVLTFPDKKNRLEFIEEEIKKVQEHKKILTEKEKELEKLATEKEWEEVDNSTDK